jgi:hypothetical protein
MRTVLLLAALGGPALAAQQSAGPIVARALDSGWAAADSVTDFRQRDPDEGAAATERTVVKVLHDHDALSIQVHAWDRDAAHVRATQLRRDADLSADDNITILIDSFHDRRGGFVFQTNPNGARWDAQITETDNVNQDWNGIWDVTVTRDSAGWTAVFRIPFRTLRFASGARFGFNVRRFIRRRNEEDLWRGWHRTEGLYQLLAEGELSGLDDVRQARDVEIKPYVLADAFQALHDSVGNRIGGAGVAGKVGVDAKVAVTPTMTADLTVNTDFAQVEVDSQVINLTRFPTFFPEKRDFFLESSGLFDFGSSEDKTLLFYSRRIGLTDSGVVVPILAGARLTGKAGPWAIGVLDTRTGGVDDANDAVIRIKHDLFDRSYVGAIFTDRSGSSVHGNDVAGGLDADFPLLIGQQNIEPKLWIAATQTPDTAGTRAAWQARVDFPNDLFDNNIAISRYDSGFAPSLGFIRRTDVWETDGHIDFMPRPHALGIRQFDFQIPSWDIYANHNGSLANARDWQNAQIQWQPVAGTLDNGDQFAVLIQRFMDAPPPPPDTFNVFRNIVIPAGRYWWTQTAVQYQTSLGRSISLYAFASTGGFYNGHSTETDGSITWRSGGHLIVGAGLSRTEAGLPVGHFVAVQSSGRIEYAFTTRADFLGFAQYDDALERTDFDLRFHWSPVIGDDLYVVWNSGYTNDPLSRYRFPDWGVVQRPLTATFTVKYVHRIVP